MRSTVPSQRVLARLHALPEQAKIPCHGPLHRRIGASRRLPIKRNWYTIKGTAPGGAFYFGQVREVLL